jgi:hypothetical protein
VARKLSEEDAEKLWDLGTILQELAYRVESRGDSALLGAWGREVRLVVERSGGQPRSRVEAGEGFEPSTS